MEGKEHEVLGLSLTGSVALASYSIPVTFSFLGMAGKVRDALTYLYSLTGTWLNTPLLPTYSPVFLARSLV